MRMTVIIDDATVIVDGDARIVSMPVCDANWHAIQWYGTHGTIEVKLGERIWIEADTGLVPFVEAWEAALPPAPPPSAPASGVVEL